MYEIVGTEGPFSRFGTNIRIRGASFDRMLLKRASLLVLWKISFCSLVESFVDRCIQGNFATRTMVGIMILTPRMTPVAIISFRCISGGAAKAYMNSIQMKANRSATRWNRGCSRTSTAVSPLCWLVLEGPCGCFVRSLLARCRRFSTNTSGHFKTHPVVNRPTMRVPAMVVLQMGMTSCSSASKTL